MDSLLRCELLPALPGFKSRLTGLQRATFSAAGQEHRMTGVINMMCTKTSSNNSVWSLLTSVVVTCTSIVTTTIITTMDCICWVSAPTGSAASAVLLSKPRRRRRRRRRRRKKNQSVEAEHNGIVDLRCKHQQCYGTPKWLAAYETQKKGKTKDLSSYFKVLFLNAINAVVN